MTDFQSPPDKFYTSKKRERPVDISSDESYVRNKRLLQESLKSLTIADTNRSTPLPMQPSYATYDLHGSHCPSHSIFHMDSNEEIARQDSTQSAMSCEDTSKTENPSNLQRMSSIESTSSTDSNSTPQRSVTRNPLEESYIESMKGGKRKYIRKVDYLVDEIIRKSRKTHEISPQHMQLITLPEFVGISPRNELSQKVSITIPFSIDFCSLTTNQTRLHCNTPIIPDPPLAPLHIDTTHMNTHNNDMSNNNQMNIDDNNNNNNASLQPILLSGEITHSDWGIVNVTSPDLLANTSRTTNNTSPLTPLNPTMYEYHNIHHHHHHDNDDKGSDQSSVQSDMACCEELVEDEDGTDGRSSDDNSSDEDENRSVRTQVLKNKDTNFRKMFSSPLADSSSNAESRMEDEDDGVESVGTF